MKRILVGVLLLAGCGGAVEGVPPSTTPALTKASVPAVARDDGNSNPMPGQPPPSDPAASNPMPGQPPVDDPLAPGAEQPGASNPMPGINTGVTVTGGDYTR